MTRLIRISSSIYPTFGGPPWRTIEGRHATLALYAQGDCPGLMALQRGASPAAKHCTLRVIV